MSATKVLIDLIKRGWAKLVAEFQLAFLSESDKVLDMVQHYLDESLDRERRDFDNWYKSSPHHAIIGREELAWSAWMEAKYQEQQRLGDPLFTVTSK